MSECKTKPKDLVGRYYNSWTYDFSAYRAWMCECLSNKASDIGYLDEKCSFSPTGFLLSDEL